jgi:hypothetical protein
VALVLPMYRAVILAREAESVSDLLPDMHITAACRPNSLSEIVDFSRFLAIPTAPMIHTVSCARASCDCLDPNNHASVMEHLRGNTLSDMTIQCHGRVYHANRDVVCPKSSFFDRAMNGYFKVNLRTLVG